MDDTNTNHTVTASPVRPFRSPYGGLRQEWKRFNDTRPLFKMGASAGNVARAGRRSQVASDLAEKRKEAALSRLKAKRAFEALGRGLSAARKK